MQQSRISLPNPFEIAIALTLLVFVLASLLTDSTVTENLNHWGQGLWSLLTFMSQMSLILLGGFVLAMSKPVRRLLKAVVKVPRNSTQVYLLTFFVSALACWLNWGLGLMTGAFLTLEMARRHPKINFPLLVAISYMGFVFWHAGLSGSIPLLVGTPDNFSYQWLGELYPLQETVLSNFNLALILCLLLALAAMILFFARKHEVEQDWSEYFREDSEELDKTEKSLFSQFSYVALICLLLSFVAHSMWLGQFKIGLNQVNLLLFTMGLVFHGSLQTFMASAQKGGSKLVPILIQYPLYAGIMGVIVESGLAEKISNGFVAMSSERTYSLYMFLSAGLVNFFVPSGGGQWAVQAAVVVEGAKQLGVPLEKVIMAVAWGDAWTNLAQPFWALPLLAIVGLELRHIMGYCLSALVVSGLVIGGFFLVF